MTTTLRTSTGDLSLPRAIVTDPAQVACQTINDGLRLWRTSWFLDQSAGFPWLQVLGQKVVNASQLKGLLRKFLLSVPGITQVFATATFDRPGRSFSYDYSATFNGTTIIKGSSSSPATAQTGPVN